MVSGVVTIVCGRLKVELGSEDLCILVNGATKSRGGIGPRSDTDL